MNSEIKFVGKIEGSFFIPSYQRGYRWAKKKLNDCFYSIGFRNQNITIINKKYLISKITSEKQYMDRDTIEFLKNKILLLLKERKWMSF
ncbi:hypothetical protein [Thermoanaerobacterium thermosaccharolyticum]|uniref:hypothetical protein n=1 Tax=Thermoanaerobacterium thermosaccharolyticum TaxID=1517 RepID=UPI003DA8DDDF